MSIGCSRVIGHRRVGGVKGCTLSGWVSGCSLSGGCSRVINWRVGGVNGSSLSGVISGCSAGGGLRWVGNFTFSIGGDRCNDGCTWDCSINISVKKTSFFMQFFLEGNPDHVIGTIVANLLMDVCPFNCNWRF